MADKDSIDFSFTEIAHDVGTFTSSVQVQTWGIAILYVLVGFLVAGYVSKLIGRLLKHHTSAHYTLLIRRIFYYGIIILGVVFALATLQLDMKVLGVATIVTLALGFASQAAVSNIISGLFLVFEQPFVVGDIIEYKGVTGELLSIDLLSIKVRTDSNSQVRIPNEELLKNQFMNLTRFPTRRLEVKLRISVGEDMDKVRATLMEIARKNMLVLDKPVPKLIFVEFNDAAIVFNFAVWVDTENFDALKLVLPYEIQKAFNEQGFQLPITHYLQVAE